MESKRPTTLMQAMRYFDADTADKFIQSIKWPSGPVCENCGSVNIGRIASRRRFQCRDCRTQFGLFTGTIMESTHLRSDQWMVAVWMIVTCRNGVSSCEIARTIGCKQQSAWHLLHRVREVLKPSHDDKLSGIVEADSTLVGGILKNMPAARRARIESRNPRAGKTIVHALRERKTGNIRAGVIENESASEIAALVTGNIEPGSCLNTDCSHVYKGLKLGYIHKSVNHSIKEYVRGDVHVNGCENFFNCLRRGLKGTYIKASPQHLAAYIDEAVFRFNNRHDDDWTRFESAMRKIVGKRLMYKTLTGGAVR